LVRKVSETQPEPVRSSEDDPNDRHGQPFAPFNIYADLGKAPDEAQSEGK
jgi:hypothetical protein